RALASPGIRQLQLQPREPVVRGSPRELPLQTKKRGKTLAFPLLISSAHAMHAQRTLRQAGLGFFHERGKTCLVENRDVCQNLAVKLNVGLLQSVHETAVGHAVLAGTRVDAGNPQATEHPLLVAAVTVGVLARLDDSLLGNTEHLAARVVVALCLLQHLGVTGAGEGTS